jgi:hypothetical protein
LMPFVPGNSPIAKRKSVSFKKLFDFPIVCQDVRTCFER